MPARMAFPWFHGLVRACTEEGSVEWLQNEALLGDDDAARIIREREQAKKRALFLAAGAEVN